MTPEREAELLAQIDTLSARVAELEVVPRCGATTASVFENADPIGPCIHNHGHGGMHEEADKWRDGPDSDLPMHIPGAQWFERNDPLAVAHARIRELEAELAETRADRETFRATLEQDAKTRTGRQT